MAVKKKRGRGPKSAAPSQPEIAGFWESSLNPFLERYSWLLALCLIGIASIRIVSTYSELSLTFDEPGHFACGLEYLSKHVYRYESQHPPLARAAAALGPFLDGTRLRGNSNRDKEGVDILLHTPNRDRTVALMRLGILPYFWLAGLVVYFWSRRAFGGGTAVVATGLFTLVPTVLAHAGLATTDMALAGALSAAFVALLLWVETPTWGLSLLLGLTSAMAALTKFSSLGYLPATALFTLILWLAVKRPGMTQLRSLAAARLVPFGAAILTGMLVVWAAYWFSFGKVPRLDIVMPAPEFFDGITDAARHNAGGNSSYLLGEVRVGGWWYFFPIALAVKTPIAFLLLAAVGVWLCWQRRRTSGYVAPIGFCLGILLPAMTSNINIGVRHVLPIYSGMAILGAVALVHMCHGKTLGMVASAVLLLWMAASGARSHPDYLAYFNELGGADPGRILVDSDLDWGQQMKWLSRRLAKAGAKEYSQNLEGWVAGMNLYGLPPARQLDVENPPEGWAAVSSTIAKHTRREPILHGTSFESLGNATRRITPWYDTMEPLETYGGLRLYKLPARR